MNDMPDPFEAELSAMQPQPISDKLLRSIAGRLAEPVPARRRSSSKLILAGSLAAACLAVVVWSWMDDHIIETPPEFVRPKQVAVAAADSTAPMLLGYQRALARSPEEFDILLNRHAGLSPLPDLQLVRVGAFTRSDAALHNLLGDD